LRSLLLTPAERPDGPAIARHCIPVQINRVRYWRSGHDERVVILTAFSYMIALDTHRPPYLVVWQERLGLSRKKGTSNTATAQHMLTLEAMPVDCCLDGDSQDRERASGPGGSHIEAHLGEREHPTPPQSVAGEAGPNWREAPRNTLNRTWLLSRNWRGPSLKKRRIAR
jgi:hypothetical protein